MAQQLDSKSTRSTSSPVSSKSSKEHSNYENVSVKKIKALSVIVRDKTTQENITLLTIDRCLTLAGNVSYDLTSEKLHKLYGYDKLYGHDKPLNEFRNCVAHVIQYLFDDPEYYSKTLIDTSSRDSKYQFSVVITSASDEVAKSPSYKVEKLRLVVKFTNMSGELNPNKASEMQKIGWLQECLTAEDKCPLDILRFILSEERGSDSDTHELAKIVTRRVLLFLLI